MRGGATGANWAAARHPRGSVSANRRTAESVKVSPIYAMLPTLDNRLILATSRINEAH